MALHLYDTYERSAREFRPIDPPNVGLYACGPTVYDYAHIGNLRTYIFEDVLRRTLEARGFRVNHVVNITDVGHLVSDADTGEDKMEAGSRRTGRSAWEIAELYTAAFKDDLRRLNIREPTTWCKATEHIPEQIELIRCIEAKGFTYQTGDGIYFDTSKLPDYGRLARLDIAGLRAGARVDVAEKRNPTDFALWKFSPPDSKRQMEWESPWGVGFPGWHIECSAMSAKYLGPQFDIHCGGEDHPSVHHSNEIAQSEACHGTRLAHFWMHGAFLRIDDQRMSKSSGEFLRLQSLIDRGYDPLVYRYLVLGAHYRTSLVFSWDSLDAAATALDRLRAALPPGGEGGAVEPEAITRFDTAMDDDLNTPRALAVVWDLVKGDHSRSTKRATLLAFDRILGLGLGDWRPREVAVPGDVMDLVKAREVARQARQWREADRLRDAVRSAGFEIDDTPDGSRVRPLL